MESVAISGCNLLLDFSHWQFSVNINWTNIKNATQRVSVYIWWTCFCKGYALSFEKVKIYFGVGQCTVKNGNILMNNKINGNSIQPSDKTRTILWSAGSGRDIQPFSIADWLSHFPITRKGDSGAGRSFCEEILVIIIWSLIMCLCLTSERNCSPHRNYHF